MLNVQQSIQRQQALALMCRLICTTLLFDIAHVSHKLDGSFLGGRRPHYAESIL